jgi:hypothetical protein
MVPSWRTAVTNDQVIQRLFAAEGRVHPFSVGAVVKHKEQNMERPIYEIAQEIKKDWNLPYFGAVPYLNAMCQIRTIDQMYGMDDARSVVVYFLANAQQWRGETARRIKAELKKLAGIK